MTFARELSGGGRAASRGSIHLYDRRHPREVGTTRPMIPTGLVADVFANFFSAAGFIRWDSSPSA